MKKAFILLLASTSLLTATPRLRPAEWAQPIIGTELENCYKVSDKVYRSEQPGPQSFGELERFGITGVLNLRRYHNDNDEAEDTTLRLHSIKMSAGWVTEQQIVEALRIINNSKGPVLVHCWHGSDRTGVVVAAYRIVIQGWPKEKAMDEMRNGGYGYHASLFSNLMKLLRDLNVEAVKEEIGIQ